MKPTAQPQATARQPPRVWVLAGHKAGDNNQLLALAEALDWPYEIKKLRYRRSELLSNLLLPTTLAGVQTGRSSPLAPPWPDLVLTAGRRNEPVARWIAKQSGARAKLVHVGRPWARPDRFDLVITTPQYRVPAAPNVLLNNLPLHRASGERLAREADRWSAKLSHLARPYLALLVGGNSGPYVFDRRRAACLAGEAVFMAKAAGGSLLITSSARTPDAVVDELTRQTANHPHYFHRWQNDDQDNPYFGFLGLADRFIVTGESVSMLTEACESGRPVYIFDPGQHPLPLRCSGPDGGRHPVESRRWWQQTEHLQWKPLTHRLAQWLGPHRMRRDVGAMHRQLVASGLAVWLGEQHAERLGKPVPSDLPRAVARVQALFRLQPA